MRITTWPWCLLGLLLAAPSAAAETPGAPPDYRVAVGAGAALGAVGWGTEIGSLLEVSGRAQLLPWLGAGAAFLELSATNNENYPVRKVRALEAFASAHPGRTRWLDPFLRLGAVRVVDAGHGVVPGDPTRVSPWGLEGTAGLDVAARFFALGLDLRHGFTNRSWTMAGLHFEIRLPLF